MRQELLPRDQAPERENLVLFRPTASLCARIASHTASAPDWPAVVDGTGRLTFADLERQSNQLAAHLREAGAGPECCVGLFLERSAPVRGRGPGGPEDRRRVSAAGSVHACGSGGVHPRRRGGASAPHAPRQGAGPGAGQVARHRDRWPGRGANPDAAVRVRPRRAGPRQPGLCHLHVRLHGPAQGRRNHPREPGQPHRVASGGVPRHGGRPRQPGRGPRLRCGGVGDLASPDGRREPAHRRRADPPLAPGASRLARCREDHDQFCPNRVGRTVAPR